MRANWLDWKEAALDWIYPRRCGLCGLLNDRAICDTCSSELIVYDGALTVPNVDHSIGAYVYEGRAAQAVKRLKYERVVTLAAPMAAGAMISA